MGSHKLREQRRVVFVSCRLRDDSGWSDMTICNLSSHGLMARCKAPPPRGAFIEVRRGGVSVVGQVRWSRDNQVGIRTQERIDILSLVDDASAQDGERHADRRAASRKDGATQAKPTPAALGARSRRWSRLFDRAVITSVGIVSAVLLAQQVHSLLAAPLEQARAAMAR
jgi:hypothetical protein